MGKSLAQYAAENPQNMPKTELDQLQRAAEARAQERLNILDREQRQAKADRLKEIITAQLEEGEPLQHILYSALDAIGILSGDEEWSEAGKKCLSEIYDGLEQQSLLVDNAAIEAQRIEQMRTRYNERLRKQIRQQLSGYRKIERCLNDALSALDGIEE